MATRANNRKTWIRPLDLSDTASYGTNGPAIPGSAVTVLLSSGNKIDLWLESGRLQMVTVTPKTEIIVTRGTDGGFEVRVEKIR